MIPIDQKGIATGMIIKFVLMVIVIAIAIYFIVYIFDLGNMLLTNDQWTLKQYSTCAVAYCAGGGAHPESGEMSDEVNRVGCLKYSGGQCDMSCRDVQSRIFTLASRKDTNGKDIGSFKDAYGRPHFCGKDFVIPFEFEGTSSLGKVPLASGEMDRIATAPSWVCKSLRIPLTTFDIDSVTSSIIGINTADWQYHGFAFNPLGGGEALLGFGSYFSQNCMMLSKANTDHKAYFDLGVFVASFFIKPAQVAGKAATGASDDVAKPLINNILKRELAVKTIKTSYGTLTQYGITATGKIVGVIDKYLVKLANGAIKSKGALDDVVKNVKSVRVEFYAPKKVPGLKNQLEVIKEWGTSGVQKGTVNVLALEAGASALNLFNMKSRGGCFTGFVYDISGDDKPSREDLLYTPIIQYSDASQKVYPSAIYVDSKFTDPATFGEAECEFINPDKAVRKNVFGDDDAVRDEALKEIERRKDEFRKEGVLVTTIETEVGTYAQAHVTKSASKETIDAVKDLGDNVVLSDEKLEDDDIDAITEEEITSQVFLEYGIDKDDPIIGVNYPGTDRFDYGNMVSKCKFRTSNRGEKITYYVYASPTFPGAAGFKFRSGMSSPSETSIVPEDYRSSRLKKVTISGKSDQINKFLSEDSDLSGNDLIRSEGELSGFFREMAISESALKGLEDSLSNEDKRQKAFADPFNNWGSCTYVTLLRDLGGGIDFDSNENVEEQKKNLDFSEASSEAVAGISESGLSESGASIVSSDGKYYAFYTSSDKSPLEGASNVMVATSSDGKTWSEKSVFSEAAESPSSAILSGKVYTAYVRGSGNSADIFVKPVGGSEEDVVSGDRIEQGGPGLVSVNGELFVFYHQKASDGKYSLMYAKRSVDEAGKVSWEAGNLVLEGDGLRLFPSAIAMSDRPEPDIMVAYSYSEAGVAQAVSARVLGVDRSFDIKTFRVDPSDGSVSDERYVIKDPVDGRMRDGHPRLVNFNGVTYAFFDRDTTNTDPSNFDNLNTGIAYSKYNSYQEGWNLRPQIVIETESKVLMPSAFQSGDNIGVTFSSYKDGEWDMKQAFGKNLAPEIPEELDIPSSLSVDIVDKKEQYGKDDVVKFSGKLQIAGGGSAEGLKLKAELHAPSLRRTTQVDWADVVSGSDGSFTGEFSLGRSPSTGQWKIVVAYGGKEDQEEFKVVG